MDIKVLSFDEMKSLADGFVLKYHPNIGEDKLREKLERYVDENPGCLDVEEIDEESSSLPEIPVVPEVVVPETPTAKGKIRIKSQHIGEISSRFGVIDFGTDGIAELDEEAAEYFCSLPNGYTKC